MRPATSLYLAAALTASLTTSGRITAEDRATKVRKDLQDVLAGGKWIYNDLPRGFEEARKTGKPLLVVIRCIPCEACRGFDEQVASIDQRIEKLLDGFVRVRIPQSNGLDLSLFQFDYDLSFYAFFLNADRTIYGRFGSKSTQQDKKGDESIDAFREALSAVLDLHAKYAQVKDSLRAKTGPALAIQHPEDHPLLKEKFGSKLNYEGDVVKSCIHCHQIRESERKLLRKDSKALPDKVLYPWPLPDAIGLPLDPRKRATVLRVDAGSPAERAGFQPGDDILELAGQPLISIADVQWVLESTGDSADLAARVRRGGETRDLKVQLGTGWRKRSDISWRVTSWDLRRMAAGGLLLEQVSADDRRAAGIPEGSLALRVKHAGEYGEHAVAKNAGVQKGDIIVAVDGKKDPLRETDFLALGLQGKLPGDKVEITLLREGVEKKVSFALQ